ncbi:YjfB family protein [Ammoniphilus resinae]|uniref:Motility protein n=1 Tax=Ammoniphilus resinae TaxID=861532 RepID=A0ABS4GMF3_9BACL|nr:YjfB family protein [Ammoniphilus resinae]MBP1931460.1 hypothetical protein [Ammoniphilus resinae]
MDIAALSISLSQAKIMQEASTSVMKMAMDTAKTNAANLTDMLGQTKAVEQAMQPHLGSQLDVRL